MELRHLRYFAAVAEELHFGRAAARLGMAQPPLSQQILRLEEKLQIKLLNRNKHKVELTSAGVVFLRCARRLLIDADNAVQLARQAARGEIGQLSIGHTHAADLKILPEILAVYRTKYPSVAINLLRSSAPELIAAVRSQRFDVGVVRLPVVCEDLIITTISREPLIIALPAKHPLASYERVPIAALATEPHVLFPRHRAPGYFDFLANICSRAGFTLTVAHESDSLQTTLSLVSMGLGVSFQPQCVQQLARCGVIFRPFDGDAPTLEMATVHRPGEISESLKRFLKVARNNLQAALPPA